MSVFKGQEGYEESDALIACQESGPLIACCHAAQGRLLLMLVAHVCCLCLPGSCQVCWVASSGDQRCAGSVASSSVRMRACLPACWWGVRVL